MSTKRQFLRFSLVGTIGFMVDAGVLYLCLPGLGLHGGRVVSFLCAATTTWYLNRKLTFTQCDIAQPARQWARFLVTNGIGGLINFATYGLVIFAFGGAGLTPLIGVATGSIAGLGFNFTVSRRFVFEEQAPLRAQI